MTDIRSCEQCGTAFSPRREHARFCSARCRVAWNREHVSDRAGDASALDWSITAMQDATGRLGRVRARDRPRALAVISEAVWWVTIVDATLVRYHPETYDRVLADRPPGQRRSIEQALAGLRFVRNRIGQHADPVDFITPVPDQRGQGEGSRGEGGRGEGITAWRWRSVPEPALTSLPPRGRSWEATRYRAYQAQLSGRTVGEIFERAAGFLEQAAARAAAGSAGPSGPPNRADPGRADPGRAGHRGQPGAYAS